MFFRLFPQKKPCGVPWKRKPTLRFCQRGIKARPLRRGKFIPPIRKKTDRGVPLCGEMKYFVVFRLTAAAENAAFGVKAHKICRILTEKNESGGSNACRKRSDLRCGSRQRIYCRFCRKKHSESLFHYCPPFFCCGYRDFSRISAMRRQAKPSP